MLAFEGFDPICVVLVERVEVENLFFYYLFSRKVLYFHLLHLLQIRKNIKNIRYGTIRTTHLYGAFQREMK